MTVSDEIFSRMTARALMVLAAAQIHTTAHTALTRAQLAWGTTPCESTARAQVMAEGAADEARDAVIVSVTALATTAAMFLSCVPVREHTPLREQVAGLQTALRTEEAAFARYADVSGGATRLRLAWQAVRDDIVARAHPLATLIVTLPAPIGSAPTELDDSPAAARS